MRRLKSGAAMALTGLMLVGCAANDIAVKRQVETDARLEMLFQTVGGLEARINELSSRLAAFESVAPKHEAEIKQLQATVIELGTATQTLQAEVNTMLATASPKVELVNPDPSGKAKESGPPAAYLKAFGLYSANNFSGAVSAFEKFISDNPKSDYVPNSYYWLGECYYSVSDLSRALPAFQKVLDGWPKHPKAPDALLKIGMSFGALRQTEKARKAFETLIKSYPGSVAAAKARERLLIYDAPASLPDKNAR